MAKNASCTPVFTLFLLFLWFTSTFLAMAQETKTTAVNVGVVVDSNTGFGKMALSCISMALSDFYATHPSYETRLVLHVRNSSSYVVATASAVKLSYRFSYELVFPSFVSYRVALIKTSPYSIVNDEKLCILLH